MDDMRIRKYKPADFDEVEKFWNENNLGGSHRGDDALLVAQTIAAGGHLLLMVSREGHIIGTSWLTNDKRRTYLHHFGIAEKFRGLGLAGKLLDATLAIAKEDGLQIKIEVHRENEAALRLYKRAGFKYLGDYDVYMIRKPETEIL